MIINFLLALNADAINRLLKIDISLFIFMIIYFIKII